MDSRQAWIALNLIGLARNTAAKLVRHFDTAIEVLESPLEEIAQVEGILHKTAEKIKNFKIEPALSDELKLVEKRGVKVITLEDAEYPELLKEIFDPPLVLYIRGDILPQDRYALAIVGTRNATRYGLRFAEDLGRQLGQIGLTVVSGMARGIDSSAHRGAIAASGRTIAVLGCGVDVVYPPENDELAEKIAASGAVISEFPLSTQPYPANFPIRNRIISGLSLGTIVVEAGERSGALITSDCALEHGREVFAVPGPTFSKYSQGTHKLIKQGAKLVDRIEDILEEIAPHLDGFQPKLAADVAETGKAAQAEAVAELSNEERRVMDVLSYDMVHIDEIIMNVDLPTPKVLSILSTLEMKNLVLQEPGKLFRRND